MVDAWPSVVLLSARSCLLRTFPIALAHWRLISLDMGNNGLLALPPAIGNLRELRHLKLAGNLLTSLPSSLGGCRALSTLDVDSNRLEHLPSSLQYCTQLIMFRAFGNELRHIPAWFGCWTSMRLLLLTSNKVEVIHPMAFITQTPLEESAPERPEFASIASIIDGSSPSRFEISDEEREAVRVREQRKEVAATKAAAEAVEQWAAKGRDDSVETAGCGIGTSLTHFFCDRNSISTLPSTFSAPMAQVIGLACCGLVNADGVFHVRGTEFAKHPCGSLNLSFNSLTSCPPLGTASVLTALQLSGNPITDGVGLTRNLASVSGSLKSVSLAYLPAFAGMPWCAVANGDVTSDDIACVNGWSMNTLQALDLSGCGIKAVPPFCLRANMPLLVCLVLSNNVLEATVEELATADACKMDVSLNPVNDMVLVPETKGRAVKTSQSRYVVRAELMEHRLSAGSIAGKQSHNFLYPQCWYSLKKDGDNEESGPEVGITSSRAAIGFSDTVGRRSTQEDAVVCLPNILACIGKPKVHPAMTVRLKMPTLHESAALAVHPVLVRCIGVFDGHGGTACSGYAAAIFPALVRNALVDDIVGKFGGSPDLGDPTSWESCPLDLASALRKAFAQLADLILTGATNYFKLGEGQSGTTATVCIAVGKWYAVAAVGDSRASLIRLPTVEALASGDAGDAEELTVDHKVESFCEGMAIFERGGFVSKSLRVNDRLGMTRAFGNHGLSKFICVEPYETGVKQVTGSHAGDPWGKFKAAADLLSLSAWAGEYVVVACDGVWDDSDERQILQLMKKNLEWILKWSTPEHDDTPATYGRRILCRICGLIRDNAYTLGSEDNISVTIIRLS